MTMMMVMAMGGLGVLTVACVAAISLRRASASLRHSVWLAALIAVLTLPALELTDLRVAVTVPAELVMVLPAWTVNEAGAPAVAASRVPGPIGATDRHEELPITLPSAAGAKAPGSAIDGRPQSERQGSSGAAVGTPVEAGSLSLAAGSPGSPTSAATARGSFSGLPLGGGTVAFAIWLIGALLLLGVTTSSHLRAWFIVRGDGEAASLDALTRLEAARLQMAVKRPVGLVVSRRIAVPATWGFLRPVVVLPAKYRRWSDETLDRVLFHELAHVARRDCEAYLVGDLARAVHWFNPLAWWAARNLRAESERACDDRVLDVVSRPSAYAADLVAMVRTVTGSAGVPRAALAMAQPGSVSDRVRAILDPSLSRSRVRTPAAATIGVVALGLVLAATVVTPTATSASPDTSAPTGASASLDPSAPTPASASPDTPGAAAPSALPPSVPEPSSVPRAGDRVVPVPSVAGPQERLCIFRTDERRSTTHHTDEDGTRIRWETDDCRVDIDILGHVQFSADDRSIVALGPDARFEIEERFERDERRARLEGRSGGGIERRYWVDGDEVSWGPEADRWLASILPEIFRHTTINAEARVQRMVADGGPDRVFEEVLQIQSDHVSRRYLELLMDAVPLNEGQYRRVIEAAAQIDSDHGSAELLMAVIARAGLQSSFQDPLLAASERLDSDHQRTRILRALLDSPLSGVQLDAVLQSARSIDSDHNLGELLSSIASAGRMNDASRVSFLETLRSIDSDHQQAVVLHAFLDSGQLSDSELARVLDLTDNLGSDHQRADILQRVAREYPLTGGQVSAYLRSAAGMESDHQVATTAMVITERSDFDREQMLLVLRMASGVESDHQQSEILGSVIRRRPLDGAELSEVMRVAATMDSSHQLRGVVSLILEEQNLGPDTLIQLLDVVTRIDSSHQKTEALLDVARRYELSGVARDRYTALASALGERDRERLLAAISG